MEKKIVYRIFTIADYEREALYFREMHAKGWKLRKVSYSILLFAVKYTFEKCLISWTFTQWKNQRELPIYNCLKTVAGSILQTLIVFPILEKYILKLNRMQSLKFIMTRPGS